MSVTKDAGKKAIRDAARETKVGDINSFRARWYVQRGGKVQLTDNYRARERRVLLMIHIQTKIPDR